MATKTFVNMKTEVARFVKLPTDTEVLTICGEAINSAIDGLINVRNWSWQMTTSDFQLFATSGTYNVPSDFRQQRNLSLLNTAGEVAQRVPYEEPKLFDTRFTQGNATASDTGTPLNYTITDAYPSGVIRFDNIPDTATVTTHPSGQLMYYARVGEMSADGDVMSVPPEVESMVLWYAKSYVASLFAQDQTSYAESRWQPLFRQLKRNESDVPDFRRRR